jgi:hypothetical protein
MWYNFFLATQFRKTDFWENSTLSSFISLPQKEDCANAIAQPSKAEMKNRIVFNAGVISF